MAISTGDIISSPKSVSHVSACSLAALNSFEEVKTYLPQYLTNDSQKELFSELKQFPSNLDQRFYTKHPPISDIIYQGDGFSEMLMISLPSTETGCFPAMILSNTCDLDVSNKRMQDVRILYAPIIKLDKYKRMLLTKAYYSINRVYEHLDAIRKQRISHIFYLPIGQYLKYEGIVLLDRINNCPRSSINSDFILKKRLFMLSNYGFYLFLVKLSINFSRIREGVDRV